MISKLAMLTKKVIEAAWLNGRSYDLATQAAEALESAQLLQSPETAAELHTAGMLAAAELVDGAFHGEPFPSYPPDFAALVREKAQETCSRRTAAGATPTEFFRPGRTYIRNLPFRALEDVPGFECVGVSVHPTKGTLRAFGFERPGAGSPWVSAAQHMEKWADGWVDLGPTEPDRLTRTFAAVQALREDKAEEADG
ncbi:hypothetical protein ACQEV4_43690 [Streptomyces shenzhenensis]|uniref:hypothetical protein n=1 Tax=Streptomyces shenzhenensis TaxID=943815 RepID=UPI003D903E91